jgi:uncharacterized membrane protein
MVKKGLWILFATFALLIGLYPMIYFLIDRKFGLLNSKSVELLSNTFWNIGFYTHIVFGGIALLIGWTQFSSKMRNRRMASHRKLGKVYVVAVLLSALAGIYIGFFATGGWISSAGFICLGIVWFYTTLKAYLHIKEGEVEKHQKMMIYSYAACFAAVTLRIWLPILTIIYGDFSKAYLVVAWLCWVPNLVVGYLITRKAANQ